MIESKTLLNKLAKKFPKRIAKSYHDYVGLMTGKVPQKINKILLCLDCDWELLPYIKEIKPDIIISHHPFIYGTRAKVFKFDSSKKELCETIDKMGIPVYSYHTNFDAGDGGMNDALSNALGLLNIRKPENEMMMRIGELPNEMDAITFANFARKTFNVDYSLLINKGKKQIKTVGIIGGAGSRDWRLAKKEGCDIYISGDAPHYVRRDISNDKYNYLDMPHEIEKIFMPTMKKLLLSYDKNLDVVIIDHEQLPKVIQ
ncbi:MAG: Nif3-like dinuclear metal center hexameric protein [Bacilli bacterium]|nr:Nif3-like dinuclear metal center hexameric protein [Bacilli bacterium]